MTLRWRETSRKLPPDVAGGAFSPAQAETVRQTHVLFDWPAVDGCDLYHLQVSRRRDMRVMYRPSFDCYHRESSFQIPHGGIFNPDESYYRRVRARSHAGVWSRWSEARRFELEGPRPPVNVRREVYDRAVHISWQAHPEGSQPVRYRVYGSDQRGFSTADGGHEVVGRGRVPGNLVGETDGTQMLVVAPDATHECMNRCFYRVVAVDANGTRSGCSDYVEMPHPFIISEPVTRAPAGEAYRYQARSLRSLGDLQYRDRSHPHEYFLREEIAWSLEDGPEWLTVDKDTGLVSGTPPEPGRSEVVIAATATYPYDYFASGYARRFFVAAHPEPRTVRQQFTLEVK